MDCFGELVKILQNKKEKIATMESCTGGFLASNITDVAGSSDVFEMGLVTYSNSMKMKFGVDEKVISTYTVYSEEIAIEMAKEVVNLANAIWGVGITGQLGRSDPANPNQLVNTVYYAVYHRETKQSYSGTIQVQNESRSKQKQQVISQLGYILLRIMQ